MKQNPVIALVKAWETFEQERGEGTLTEFCQHYLEKQDVQPVSKNQPLPQEDVPPMRTADGLSASLGRMTKYLHFYSRKLMQPLPVDNLEDWAYLASLYFHGSMRKSELIHLNISEFTSGTNVINRLLRHGLIEERPDPADARSKQVQITPKGVGQVMQSLPDMRQVSDLVWKGVLTEEEMQTAFHILLKADRFHSQHYAALRKLKHEEIRERMGTLKA